MKDDLKFFCKMKKPQILQEILNIFTWKATKNIIILRLSQTLASKALSELGTALP